MCQALSKTPRHYGQLVPLPSRSLDVHLREELWKENQGEGGGGQSEHWKEVLLQSIMHRTQAKIPSKELSLPVRTRKVRASCQRAHCSSCSGDTGEQESQREGHWHFPLWLSTTLDPCGHHPRQQGGLWAVRAISLKRSQSLNLREDLKVV